MFLGLRGVGFSRRIRSPLGWPPSVYALTDRMQRGVGRERPSETQRERERERESRVREKRQTLGQNKKHRGEDVSSCVSDQKGATFSFLGFCLLFPLAPTCGLQVSFAGPSGLAGTVCSVCSNSYLIIRPALVSHYMCHFTVSLSLSLSFFLSLSLFAFS